MLDPKYDFSIFFNKHILSNVKLNFDLKVKYIMHFKREGCLSDTRCND